MSSTIPEMEWFHWWNNGKVQTPNGHYLPPPPNCNFLHNKMQHTLYPEIAGKKFFSLAFWIKTSELFKKDEILETVNTFIPICLKTKLGCSESLTHITGSLKLLHTLRGLWNLKNQYILRSYHIIFISR